MLVRTLSMLLSLGFVISVGCKSDDAKDEPKQPAKPTSPANKRTKADTADAQIAKKPAPPKPPPSVKPVELEPGKDLYGDKLDDGTSVRMGTARFRHRGTPTAVAVSPDGSVVVSCAFGGNSMWDITTGKRLRGFKGCGKGLYFNADGTKLITTEREHIKVLDYVSAKTHQKLKVHDKYIQHLAVSRDRSKALTMSGDKSSKLVDLSTGKTLRTFKGKGWIRGIALSPDAAWAALHFEEFAVFNTATGKTLELALEGTPRADAYAFSPDSKRIAIGKFKKIQVWDLKTAKVVLQFDVPSSASALSYSPDGSVIAFAVGNDITLVDANTGKAKHVVKRPSRSGGKLVFSPDGKRLISIATFDTTIRVIDVDSGKELLERPAHHRTVSTIAFAKGGSRVISAGEWGVVRAWNRSNGVQQAVWRPHGSEFRRKAVAPSKDSRFLAVAGGSRVVHLWDTAAGKATKTLTITAKGRFQGASSVAINPDASVVAALTRSHAVVWEVKTATQRAAWAIPKHTTMLALSPDGKFAATVVSHYKDATSNLISLWDTTTGKLAHALTGHTKRVSKIRFLPDGRLVSLSDDNTVRFWDVKAGKELSKMGRSSPRDIAVSEDGKRIAIADGWGNVEIWELSGPVIVHKLKLHIWFKAIALSADGKTFASADATNNVVLWQLPR